MATNAWGLPYPVGTDRVFEGDNAIRALADAIPVFGPLMSVRGTAAQTFPGSAWAQVVAAIPVASIARKITYAPGQATITISGWYRVRCALRFTANATTAAVQLTRNSAVADSSTIAYDLRTTSTRVMDTQLQYLAAGDIVRIFGYGSSQTTVNNLMGVTFDIEFVSAP